jgi:signal transduction histidine kinase
VDQTLETVHRIAIELRPGLLDRLGLSATLEAEARSFSERTGLAAEVHAAADLPPLDAPVATALYRICQEAMTNAWRHSGASRVSVRLDVLSNRIRLHVEDDGCGFDPAAPERRLALGLLGMSERARALGGELEVRGVLPRGTLVAAEVPIRAPRAPR